MTLEGGGYGNNAAGGLIDRSWLSRYGSGQWLRVEVEVQDCWMLEVIGEHGGTQRDTTKKRRGVKKWVDPVPPRSIRELWYSMKTTGMT